MNAYHQRLRSPRAVVPSVQKWWVSSCNPAYTAASLAKTTVKTRVKMTLRPPNLTPAARRLLRPGRGSPRRRHSHSFGRTTRRIACCRSRARQSSWCAIALLRDLLACCCCQEHTIQSCATGPERMSVRMSECQRQASGACSDLMSLHAVQEEDRPRRRFELREAAYNTGHVGLAQLGCHKSE